MRNQKQRWQVVSFRVTNILLIWPFSFRNHHGCEYWIWPINIHYESNTHMYTYTHIYVCRCIYVDVCVCVCLCVYACVDRSWWMIGWKLVIVMVFDFPIWMSLSKNRLSKFVLDLSIAQYMEDCTPFLRHKKEFALSDIFHRHTRVFNK